MRKIKEPKNKLLLTLIYIIFLIIYWYFDFSCLFKSLFKIPCPGCGMFHAVLAALGLNFVAAFKYHPMFWSMPILYLYMLYDGRLFGKKYIDFALPVLIGCGFLVNWLVRLL
ncbi:MAG: DUF2752 domain-containing protein [Acutalibacteraceae bacterium]|jgi:hypothetical protein